MKTFTHKKMFLSFSAIVILFVLVLFIFTCKKPRLNPSDTSKKNDAEQVDKPKVDKPEVDKPTENSSIEPDIILNDGRFVFDPNNFDINKKEVLEYFGSMLNATQTLQSNSGFYNPTPKNPQIIVDPQSDSIPINYKIIVAGSSGHYRVLEHLKEYGRKQVLIMIYGTARKLLDQDDKRRFHRYRYIKYKATPDSLEINGTLASINVLNENKVLVNGKINIILDKYGRNSKCTFTFGGEDGKYLVFDQNNVVQSGNFIITTNGQKKEYSMNSSNLTPEIKEKLNSLNLFIIN